MYTKPKAEAFASVGHMPAKTFKRAKDPLVELPNLIEPQLDSYKWFIEEGLRDIFKEFSPMSDYSEKKFDLSFKKYELGEPKCTPAYAK